MKNEKEPEDNPKGDLKENTKCFPPCRIVPRKSLANNVQEDNPFNLYTLIIGSVR